MSLLGRFVEKQWSNKVSSGYFDDLILFSILSPKLVIFLHETTQIGLKKKKMVSIVVNDGLVIQH